MKHLLHPVIDNYRPLFFFFSSCADCVSVFSSLWSWGSYNTCNCHKWIIVSDHVMGTVEASKVFTVLSLHFYMYSICPCIPSLYCRYKCSYSVEVFNKYIYFYGYVLCCFIHVLMITGWLRGNKIDWSKEAELSDEVVQCIVVWAGLRELLQGLKNRSQYKADVKSFHCIWIFMLIKM